MTLALRFVHAFRRVVSRAFIWSRLVVLVAVLIGLSPSGADRQARGQETINDEPGLEGVTATSVAWIKRASMPTPRYGFGITAVGNLIYVVGGDNYTNLPLNTVEQYDVTANAWSTRAALPTRRWGLAAVAAGNGRVYAIGGQNCGTVNCYQAALRYVTVVEEYNPATNSWTPRASMPTARAAMGAALAGNGKIYVVGGNTGAGATAVMEEYDPATDRWTARRSLPAARSSHGLVPLNNGHLLAFGGFGDNRVFEYDPGSDTWTQRGTLAAGRGWAGVAADVTGRVYQAGGEYYGYTDTVQQFSPSSGTWSALNRLTYARRALGMARGGDGRLYAIGGWGQGGAGGYGGSGALGTVEAGAVSTTANTRPGVVLVHGWLGGPFSTQSDTCTDTLTRFTNEGSTPSGFGSIATLLQADGFDVYLAHITTGPLETPVIESNAWCLRTQLSNTLPAEGLGKVTLIAHSMGGLVSRAYLESALYADNVSRLITLGTPHVGSAYGDLACAKQGEFGNLIYNPNQAAACQFARAGIDLVNARYATRRLGVSYNLIGGDRTPLVLGWFPYLNLSDGPNDGVVGVNSGMGRLFTRRLFQEPLIQDVIVGAGVSRYAVSASHGDYNLPGWFPDYFNAGRGDLTTVTDTYRCLRQLLGIPGGACLNQMATLEAPQAPGDVPAQVLAEEFTLQSGQTQTRTVAVDTGTHSQFSLGWGAGSVSFTLQDPLGAVIDPAYATAHPTDVTYLDGSNAAGGPYSATYAFTSTVPGMYTLTVTAGDVGTGTGAVWAVQSDGPRELLLATDRDFYVSGSAAVITATLSSASNGLAGAQVSVTLAPTQAATTTVALTDRGGGVYSTTVTLPYATGPVGLRATARGVDDATVVERQADGLLAIMPTTITYGGVVTATLRDDDRNLKYEALDVTLAVTATQAGNYTFSADLLGAGAQLAAQAVLPTTLPVGPSTVVLSFDGDAIRLSGLSGPYVIGHVSVSDHQAQGLPAILNETDGYLIPSYSTNDFAATCFDLVTNATTGGFIVANPGPNCNGVQYAIGTAVTVTAIALPGQMFAGWSGDVNGGMPSQTLVLDRDLTVSARFVGPVYLPVVIR